MPATVLKPHPLTTWADTDTPRWPDSALRNQQGGDHPTEDGDRIARRPSEPLRRQVDCQPWGLTCWPRCSSVESI